MAGQVDAGHGREWRAPGWRYIDLTGQLLRRELAQRHRGTLLGGVWPLLQPLGMLAVFTFVLTQVFHARWPDAPPDAPVTYFAVMVLCGMVTYGIFNEALMRSCSVVVASSSLVKRVVFPIEVLPLVTVLAAVVSALYGYVALLAFSWFTLGAPPLTVLLLPLALLPLLLWTLGLGWLVAALGVFVRDLTHGLVIVLQALYFLSPVLYTPEQAPGWAQGVLALNPLGATIGDVRNVLVVGVGPAGLRWLVMTTTGFAVAGVGLVLFRRMKGAFADVV